MYVGPIDSDSHQLDPYPPVVYAPNVDIALPASMCRYNRSIVKGQNLDDRHVLS